MKCGRVQELHTFFSFSGAFLVLNQMGGNLLRDLCTNIGDEIF